MYQVAKIHNFRFIKSVTFLLCIYHVCIVYASKQSFINGYFACLNNIFSRLIIYMYSCWSIGKKCRLMISCALFSGALNARWTSLSRQSSDRGIDMRRKLKKHSRWLRITPKAAISFFRDWATFHVIQSTAH